MSAELMLESTSTSILIIEERKFKDIIIGVPHHAPAGIEKLQCPDHEDSDENAGFLGRYIAEKLNCCSIIACNYTIDVNKYFRSDYSMQIAQWNPKFLIEVHGHGGTKAKADIEISSGSSSNDIHSKKLADKLSVKFLEIRQLNGISICGEYDKIHFKAKDSATIRDGRWIPFHIELPAKLRKPTSGNTGKPANLAYMFCDCLIESLKELFVSNLQE